MTKLINHFNAPQFFYDQICGCCGSRIVGRIEDFNSSNIGVTLFIGDKKIDEKHILKSYDWEIKVIELAPDCIAYIKYNMLNEEEPDGDQDDDFN